MNLDNNQNNSELDDIDSVTLDKLSKFKTQANQVSADKQFASLFRDELSETVQSRGVLIESQASAGNSKNFKQPYGYCGHFSQF